MLPAFFFSVGVFIFIEIIHSLISITHTVTHLFTHHEQQLKQPSIVQRIPKELGSSQRVKPRRACTEQRRVDRFACTAATDCLPRKKVGGDENAARVCHDRRRLS